MKTFKKLLQSQLICLIYAILFVLCVEAFIYMGYGHLYFTLIIAPLSIALVGSYIAYKEILSSLIYKILSVVPYVIYVGICFLITGMFRSTLLPEDDYGMGIIVLFGVILSWAATIIGMVIGEVIKRIKARAS